MLSTQTLTGTLRGNFGWRPVATGVGVSFFISPAHFFSVPVFLGLLTLQVSFLIPRPTEPLTFHRGKACGSVPLHLSGKSEG